MGYEVVKKGMKDEYVRVIRNVDAFENGEILEVLYFEGENLWCRSTTRSKSGTFYEGAISMDNCEPI